MASERMTAAPLRRHRDHESGRGNLVGRAVWVGAWIRSRRCEFTAATLAQDMEASTRTARRWLESCEASGLVECDRSGAGWRWRAVARIGGDTLPEEK